MVRAVVVLGVAACGRVGFDATARLDGGTADTRAGDATLDGTTLGPCTKLGISDDFNDGTRAATWMLVLNNPVQVVETGGKLEVTLATAGGLHYGGYDSVDTFDLRDHCMYVSYATTPSTDMGAEMQFTARTSVGTVGYVFHTALLEAFSNTGSFTSHGLVPYDAAMHKVLRVRDDGGTMSWETSADGTSFHVLASAPDPFDISAVAVTMEAGTYTTVTSPGIARYENFDVP